MKQARNNKKKDDQKNESVKSRRSFLKKVAIGTAFAVPTIQSFSKSDILMKSALAQTGVYFTITASVQTDLARSHTASDSNGPAGGGTISPSGNVQVLRGASQSFTMTAYTGYELYKVTVDGTDYSKPPRDKNDRTPGPPNPYTFTNVQANHTIVAVFLLI